MLQIKRQGHAFNMNADYDDCSSGFVTNLGFIQSSNIRTGTHILCISGIYGLQPACSSSSAQMRSLVKNSIQTSVLAIG